MATLSEVPDRFLRLRLAGALCLLLRAPKSIANSDEHVYSSKLYQQTLKTSGFQRAAEYTGPLEVTGSLKLAGGYDIARKANTSSVKVSLVKHGAHRAQRVSYSLNGVDTHCSALSPDRPSPEEILPDNSGPHPDSPCRVTVHEGQKCDSSPGPALHVNLSRTSHLSTKLSRRDASFADSKESLPKRVISWTYHARSDGTASASDVTIVTGLNVLQLKGHTVLVSDASGQLISCAVLITSCKLILGCCLHQWGFAFAGGCSLLAVITTIVLVNRHMRYNKHFALRTCTIRILLMVPLYSIQAFLALYYKLGPIENELLKFMREVYGALVIFSFLQFILVCCGGPERLVASFHRPPVSESDDAAEDANRCEVHEHSLQHLPPLGWFLPPWSSARQMLRWCVLGTLIYVVVGLFVAITGFALQMSSRLNGTTVQIFAGLLSAAQALAILSLAELAEKLMEDLRELRPLPKFLSVKLVVFFTFWQALVLKVLVKMNFFNRFLDEDYRYLSQEQIAEATQNFLICIEMFAAGIVHIFVFPWDDYKALETKGYSLVGSPSRTRADLEELRICKLPRQIARRLTVVDFRDVCLLAYGVHHNPEEEEPNSDEDMDSTPGSDGEFIVHHEKASVAYEATPCAAKALA